MFHFNRILFLLLAVQLLTSKVNAQFYCNPDNPPESPTNGNYIDGVSLESIQNLSTGSTNTGLVDYTYYVSTDLLMGSSNQLKIYRGTSTTTKFGAWIDFNCDADFNDAGEFLGQINIGSATLLGTINFTVPVLQNVYYSRLRVRAVESNGLMEPCGFMNFGETEDYSIHLVNAPIYCEPVFSGGTAFGDYIDSYQLSNTGRYSGPSEFPFVQYNPERASFLGYSGNYYIYFNSGTRIGDTFAAWIDYNADGDYTDDGELLGTYINTAVSESASINFTVPDGGFTKFTRLRIMCVRNQANPSPCGSYVYGESEDYGVILGGQNDGYCKPVNNNGTGQGVYIDSLSLGVIDYGYFPNLPNQPYDYCYAPVCTLSAGVAHPVKIRAGTSDVGYYVIWIDYNRDGDFYDIGEKIFSVDLLFGGDVYASNIIPPTQLINGPTLMRVQAMFSFMGAPNTDPCVTFNIGETQDYQVYLQGGQNGIYYCNPAHPNGCNGTLQFINNFQIYATTLNNTSSYCEDLTELGYTNYSATENYTTNLQRGSTYEFRASAFSYDTVTSSMAMWVDLNQNGDFETTEYYNFSDQTTNQQTYSSLVSIPANAPIGNIRVRVRIVTNPSILTAENACSLLETGETEDYTVFVTDNAMLPPVPQFTTSLNNQTASFIDTSPNSPTSYLWTFPGATPSTSTQANPSGIVYPSGGCFEVTLQVSNAYGSYTVTFPCSVNIPIAPCSELYFSEYIQAAGTNVAVEIYNPTNTTIDLSPYSIRIYANGSTSATAQFSLGNTIYPYDSYLITQSGATQANLLKDQEYTSTNFSFTGNDAIVLLKNSVMIDAIGEISEDSLWLVDGFTLTNRTFRRKFNIQQGNADWDVSRYQYDALTEIDYTKVGVHESSCYVSPFGCTTTETNCAEEAVPTVVGNGGAGNPPNDFPAPFGNVYKNGKHQFIYTAIELNQLGFSAGKINSIAFNVLDFNSSTLFYKNVTIKMGCTDWSNFNNDMFVQHLEQVYDPKTFTPILGWNEMLFDKEFVWDGLTNLVVEVTFNNLIDPSYSCNLTTSYSLQNANRSLYAYNDLADIGHTTSGYPSLNRTNIIFFHCATPVPPTSAFQSNSNSICAGECITFSDASSNNPTTWSWSFSGASNASSNAQNPGQICYPIPGTYSVSLTTSNENGSNTNLQTNYIVVHPVPSTPTINFNGGIISTNTPGDTYQWYLNGDLIEGENGSEYSPTSLGEYTVTATNLPSCTSSFSEPFTLSSVGLREAEINGGVKIYPNPAKSEIWIEINTLEKDQLNIKAFDISARMINEFSREVIKNQGLLKITLEDWPAGLYFIQINGSKIQNTQRIIKL